MISSISNFIFTNLIFELILNPLNNDDIVNYNLPSYRKYPVLFLKEIMKGSKKVTL